MRSILPHNLTLLGVFLLAGLPSCRCSPPNPVPITMKVINATKSPLYVDATQNRLGLTVQRQVGGQLFGFDDLACECRYCTNVCSLSCSCPDAGVALVQRVDPGATAQREWGGVVQISGSTTCGDGTCLNQENAPLNETFSLELCYSTQKPSGTFNDAGIASGALVASAKTCVTKEFQVQDGVVEIGPQQGAACTTSADCKGADELCFGGSCTAGCPANDVPTSADYVLYVASPDNMGFFTQNPRPGSATGKQFTGTGTISSVVYAGSSIEVSLTRVGSTPGEQLTGKVTVQMPPSVGPPLKANTPVSVTVIDDGQTTPNRAVVIRSVVSNGILFAADMAQKGALLSASDLAPFVITSATVPFGCKQDDCGRFLYYERHIAQGASSIDLEPGKVGTLTLSDGDYTFLSVNNGNYPTTRCTVDDLRPWVMWHK